MEKAGNVVRLRPAAKAVSARRAGRAPAKHTLADALAAGGILTGLAWAGQTLVTLLGAA